MAHRKDYQRRRADRIESEQPFQTEEAIPLFHLMDYIDNLPVPINLEIYLDQKYTLKNTAMEHLT